MFSRLFRAEKPQPTPFSGAVSVETPAPAAALPDSGDESESEDRVLVDALVESRQRFKEIVEVTGDFAWETDSTGCFVFVSPGVTLGYRPEEMSGVAASRFLVESEAARRETPFFAREPVRDVDVWLRTSSGAPACLCTFAVPVVSETGEWRGARGVCRDVTDERRRDAAFAALQVREALMARIVRAASSEIDPDRMLRTALAETRNTFSACHVDLRRPLAEGGFEVTACAPGADGEAGSDTGGVDEAPVLRSVILRLAESRTPVTAADSERHYMCLPTVYRGDLTGALLIVRDLSAGAWTEDERAFGDELAAQFAVLLAQLDSHRQLEAMARTDEMTGLLNRRAFFADLADRVARVRNGGSAGALFYVDLDNFKLVNDVHGHKRGDEALVALADLLAMRSRPGDLVARLGGDEFAMWLERTDAEAAEARARELLAESEGLRIFSGSARKPLGISVGVAVAREDCAESVVDLTARADSAMYEIKHGGKSGYVISVAGDTTTVEAPAPGRKASA